MEQDTLLKVMDSISPSAQSASSLNYWMIIAIVELVIIILLLVLMRKPSDDKRSTMKNEVMGEGEIDFANILNSSFNAESIYKELLKKCHPDRFAPDEEKMVIATDLTARITKCKHDIKSLNQLREEAKKKLNIII